MKKGILLIAVLFSIANAGGDNKVTMTDIKEAVYNLVITSDKNNKSMQSLEERISKVEPSISLVDKNTNNISMIVDRLNELGVPANTSQNAAINEDISRFVNANKHYLPQSAAGIR
jgi:hypothetical protein